jgi:hypothetical protein
VYDSHLINKVDKLSDSLKVLQLQVVDLELENSYLNFMFSGFVLFYFHRVAAY